MWLSDTQKIGVGLTAFGITFMLLGIIMLFDAGFLAIGNILFLGGLTLVLGIQKTIIFFSRTDKLRGSICFIVGVLLVFVRWPVIGICVEMFGFINLFGDFFPIVLGFLRRLPVIGTLLNLPGISSAIDKLAGSKTLPV